MKYNLIIVSALAAVFFVGCQASSETSTTTTPSTTPSSTASKTPSTTASATPTAAPTASSAKPTDSASAPATTATAIVGKWADDKNTAYDFTPDGKFTMSGADKELTGSFSGTYKVGSDSKSFTGGKDLKITLVSMDMKTVDPSKQAAFDKDKSKILTAAAAALKDSAFKVDSATEIEIKSDVEKTSHKLTKKS